MAQIKTMLCMKIQFIMRLKIVQIGQKRIICILVADSFIRVFKNKFV